MTPDRAAPVETRVGGVSPTGATDRHGHALTGAGQTSAERYDRAVGSLLRFGDDVVDAWEETVADEPGFVMGHIGRAYLGCLSSEHPDAANAHAVLDAIGDDGQLADRERRHLDAARAYAAGDLHGAAERLDLLGVDYPRDALALAVGHQLDFFRGDAVGLRDRIGRSLTSWEPSDPWFGFLLGMHAFGLEECGHYDRAEDVGMRALDADTRDVWAHHAVLHVYEMQGRFGTGLHFADRRRPHWESGNVFVAHNAWHEALFHLELDDTTSALAIYDRLLHHAESANVALEMLDAAALLWRLHLTGDDVGDRWGPLADAWAAKVDHPWYVFNDVHAMMAFVGAGRLPEARALLDRLASYVASAPADAISNVDMTARVGLPVCSAILAYGEQRDDDVIDLLHPIRKIVNRFGGSHAQRDVVARTLLEAAIRSGNTNLAPALVSERIASRETSPFNWLQAARVRRQAGDQAGASSADQEAITLRTTSS